MVAIFLLEDLVPVILGRPFIVLHSQRYGLTADLFFQKNRGPNNGKIRGG